MMTDLEILRGRIPSYAGYGDGEQRHVADQQVRAWVGEHLAKIDGRLGLSTSDLGARYERMLRACEFADPGLLMTLEKRDFDDGTLAEVYGADRAIVEAADRSDSLERPGVDAYLGELEALFAHRAAIIVGEPEARSA
jgi:hypothetical protein